MPAAAPLVRRRGGPRPRRPDPGDLPGPCPGQRPLLVSDRHPGAARPGSRPVRALRHPQPRRPCMTATADTLAFATLVRQFFCQRLIAQQNASARTVASYRDTFRLLLAFFAENRGRSPAAIGIADLDAPVILAFLDHLEQVRGNGVRTRNARL